MLLLGELGWGLLVLLFGEREKVLLVLLLGELGKCCWRSNLLRREC